MRSFIALLVCLSLVSIIFGYAADRDSRFARALRWCFQAAMIIGYVYVVWVSAPPIDPEVENWLLTTVLLLGGLTAFGVWWLSDREVLGRRLNALVEERRRVAEEEERRREEREAAEQARAWLARREAEEREWIGVWNGEEDVPVDSRWIGTSDDEK